MVEKLKSAGLGFYVREIETRQKLGTNAMTLCVVCCLILRINYTICRQDPPASVGISCAGPPSQCETTGI